MNGAMSLVSQASTFRALEHLVFFRMLAAWPSETGKASVRSGVGRYLRTGMFRDSSLVRLSRSCAFGPALS